MGRPPWRRSRRSGCVPKKNKTHRRRSRRRSSARCLALHHSRRHLRSSAWSGLAEQLPHFVGGHALLQIDGIALCLSALRRRRGAAGLGIRWCEPGQRRQESGDKDEDRQVSHAATLHSRAAEPSFGSALGECVPCYALTALRRTRIVGRVEVTRCHRRAIWASPAILQHLSR